MTGAPPSSSGALQVIVACRLPAAALSWRTGPGAASGVTVFVVATVEVPSELVAEMSKV